MATQREKVVSSDVRQVAKTWLDGKIDVSLGLPEYDDRTKQWRIAMLAHQNDQAAVGEVRVEDGVVVFATNLDLARERCSATPSKKRRGRNRPISFPPIPSRIVLGDANDALDESPPNCIQLVFTSPPYFNAKPEYHESLSYRDYLDQLGHVFQKCHSILAEGRFLVVNTSPVLVRRAHRNASSKRLPIAFDMHAILDKIGFDFIDDIVWQKPEGAGWCVGRGRRFSADRQPLQYKPVTVTENIVVYRKRTDKLIDWNIRSHPDPEAVRMSLIGDDYERTNVWQIQPSHSCKHPAVFPEALADRVIRYYSFVGDMVLDPYAGIGTTGRVASRLGRRFFMVERNANYFNAMLADDEIMARDPDVRECEIAADRVADPVRQIRR